MMNPLEVALNYHRATKHHPNRYARSLGYLDWAMQPDPFRRFQGAPTVPLLLDKGSDTPSYDALYEPGAIPSQPVCFGTISAFFQYSLALSAWKEYQGSRWALRINPSSGNLHPTEGYLVIGAVQGLVGAPGVFHYAAKDHTLEQRCEFTADVWDDLIHGFPPTTFLAGLSSIHWREAWKYGERAYRYCQHDVGHALAALSLAAALQGWQVHPLADSSDEEIGALLGLDRRPDFEHAEREQPDLLIAVVPSTMPADRDLPRVLPAAPLDSVRRGRWYGVANRLSPDHVEWDLIDSVRDACAKLKTAKRVISTTPIGCANSCEARGPAVPARKIIRQRRSAVAMDGRTYITRHQFYLTMARLAPRFELPPWSALGPPAHVHIGLFVHLVETLAPGLYFLVRAPDQLNRLRESTRSEFHWRKPTGCPESVPLYFLTSGDFRAVAGQVSCGQDIAASGAFSLGMIADFEEPLKAGGSWIYRRLFWETGLIGQVLYLEAEAAGIRSTGIGCFFDDSVHDLFGFRDCKYQSLYHFTVGGPVEDTRLTTSPAYPRDFASRSAPTD